ncbi:MAG: TerB family tellurite resistance protein [Bacteroidota bacterium]
MDTNLKNHLKALIQLSMVDQNFDEPERSYIYSLGKANNISENEIDDLLKETILEKENVEINYQGLMSEERFDFLYDLIQLMKVDGDVYLTEIKYCEEVAKKLGYDKKVVKRLSARVYSDPSIKADRTYLMKESNKYLKI